MSVHRHWQPHMWTNLLQNAWLTLLKCLQAFGLYYLFFFDPIAPGVGATPTCLGNWKLGFKCITNDCKAALADEWMGAAIQANSLRCERKWHPASFLFLLFSNRSLNAALLNFRHWSSLKLQQEASWSQDNKAHKCRRRSRRHNFRAPTNPTNVPVNFQLQALNLWTSAVSAH